MEIRGSRRTERIKGLLLEEISRIVLRVVKDPRIKGVTLTGIKVSKDLRHARIYYSIIGDKTNHQDVQKGLLSAKGIIKKEVGRNLKLRYTPDIDFIFDDSLEYAEHIDKLLKQV